MLLALVAALAIAAAVAACVQDGQKNPEHLILTSLKPAAYTLDSLAQNIKGA